MSLVDALQSQVMALWDSTELQPSKPLLEELLTKLEAGALSVVNSDSWTVNLWVKKAILLMFRSFESRQIDSYWCDKFDLIDPVPLMKKHVRLLPGSFVRQGAFLDEGVIVLSGAFVNIGAWIGQKTMIDSGSTVGSCSYIGKHCHISSNVTIGGVLEPLQDMPVVIEDGCFIGAGSHVLEGVHLEAGSVLGAGVVLSSSIKILDRVTQKISYGRVPKNAVVVPGVHDGVSCAVMIKQVDEQTRQKTRINDLLRL